MSAPTRTPVVITLLVAVIMASPASLGAGTTTGAVSVTVAVAAAAKLVISSSTVTFPNADPDVTPFVAAAEGAISVTAKARTATGSPVELTVLAAGDLVSGPNTIGVTNVSWTASGAGFVAGTLSSSVAQTVGSWSGPGQRAGTQSFQLANSWTYATGAYSTVATYTLIAP